MKCPFCGETTTKVIDSRTTDAGVRRRRECSACGERCTTYEQVQSTVIMVVKKDGRREEFQREKLLHGLRVAARKRPLASGAVEAVVENIEHRLLNSGRSEIDSRVIGEMAITHLKTLDPIAYIRFASVYRQFVSLDDMLAELSQLADGPQLGGDQPRLFEDDFDRLVRGEAAAEAVRDPERATGGEHAHAQPTNGHPLDDDYRTDDSHRPDLDDRLPTPIRSAPSAAGR